MNKTSATDARMTDDFENIYTNVNGSDYDQKMKWWM